MDWGDVPSWVFGLVGIASAIYYRRELQATSKPGTRCQAWS